MVRGFPLPGILRAGGRAAREGVALGRGVSLGPFTPWRRSMTTLSRLATLLSLLGFLPLPSASAHMIRLDERRELTAVADCEWAHSAKEASPDEQWGYWFNYIN